MNLRPLVAVFLYAAPIAALAIEVRMDCGTAAEDRCRWNSIAEPKLESPNPKCVKGSTFWVGKVGQEKFLFTKGGCKGRFIEGEIKDQPPAVAPRSAPVPAR